MVGNTEYVFLLSTFVKILIKKDLCSSEEADSTLEITKNIKLWERQKYHQNILG